MASKGERQRNKKPQRQPNEFRNKVAKLAALRGTYMRREGWDALAEAFEKWVGPEHIDEAIETFMGGEQRPTPFDIERLSKERLWHMPLAEKLKLLASQQDCRECGNTGWKSAEVRGIPVSKRCDCPIGKLGAHKAKEAANAAK